MLEKREKVLNLFTDHTGELTDLRKDEVREGVSIADAPFHLSSVHFVLLEKREKSTE